MADVQVVGAVEVAAQLAGAGVIASERALSAATEAAGRIEEQWEAELNRRTGYTAGQTHTESEIGPGHVQATVYNDFFVARFLQNGTAHHSPKVDLFGTAAPHVEQFVSDLADAIDI